MEKEVNLPLKEVMGMKGGNLKHSIHVEIVKRFRNEVPKVRSQKRYNAMD
jgi:hypothetical protein